ncbi:MAG: ATP-binding protein [Pseudomonadota bacterium]
MQWLQIIRTKVLRAARDVLDEDAVAAQAEIVRLRGALEVAESRLRALDAAGAGVEASDGDADASALTRTLEAKAARPAAEASGTDGRDCRGAALEATPEHTQFLATLAHELRNPLNPLRSAAQILRFKGTSDPEIAWAQGVIERQVAQMARLLDDLLDASRLTRGQFELQREFVTLGYVVELAVETSRPLIEAGRHRLEITLPDGPLELEADAVRLAQALSNVLNNAATYTPDGGRIVVTAHREGAQVVIAVRDDGIGLEPERIDRLFDMVWQASPGAPRPRGGLGLGLALTRALVELHGGHVVAHSDGPGRGAEFTVRVPLAQVTRPLGFGAAAPPPSVRHRVLVVDDNRDGADGLALLLRLRGHETRTAYDGPSALALALEFAPDVVLLDVGLPGLDGYEVAARLRAQLRGAEFLIVALTGWGRDEDKRRARAAGCDDHFTKPFDPDALLERIAAPRGHWRSAAAGSGLERRRARTLEPV